MTPQDFIAKWQPVKLSERSAAQQHFLDLCDVLGQPKPADIDPTGEFYTFEKGVKKSPSPLMGEGSGVRARAKDSPRPQGEGSGVRASQGWADVWWRHKFAWEYNGKHKDLAAAYQQLQQYREDLENPPLLVVCDMDRFEVHTNFTDTPKTVHAFNLAGLAEPKNLDVLRKVFTDPQALRPWQTTKEITEKIAGRFANLADGIATASSTRTAPPISS